MVGKNWRWGRKASTAKDEAPERPRVYVRKNGSRYVKADELLRSKRGREVIERMKRVTRGRRPTPKDNKG